MISFEEACGLRHDDTAKVFAAACQDVFRSPSGKVILSILCQARHPMGFPQGKTIEETLVANGQREVVATLVRFTQQGTQL